MGTTCCDNNSKADSKAEEKAKKKYMKYSKSRPQSQPQPLQSITDREIQETAKPSGQTLSIESINSKTLELLSPFEGMSTPIHNIPITLLTNESVYVNSKSNDLDELKKTKSTEIMKDVHTESIHIIELQNVVTQQYSCAFNEDEHDETSLSENEHLEIEERKSDMVKKENLNISNDNKNNNNYNIVIGNLSDSFENEKLVRDECGVGELFDQIKRQDRYNENDCKPIIKMICEALFYMHDKHNSKKSNIKIIDFGLQSLRQLFGTLYYTPPEIITNGKYCHSCDMWSVGIVMYVMIFGFPPFYSEQKQLQETKEIYELIIQGFNPIMKSGYGPWFPKSLSSDLSKMCMDFIASLLEKDISKRLTAKEALQHSWLNNDLNDDLNDELDGRKICISHKFKYAINRIFRDQYKHMRPKRFQNVQILFSELDTNGNGKISYSEFEDAILKCNKEIKLNSSNTIKQIFNELDIDNNGEIKFENVLNSIVNDYLIASDIKLYEAFIDLDKKESGKIQISFIKQTICEINPYNNIDHILSIIDDINKNNNDGMIDYKQFLRALHPDLNQTPNWFWKKNTTIFHQEIKDDCIVKEGWMKKQGKIIHSWKLRYFRLQNNGIMRYYHNETNHYASDTFNVKTLTKLSNKSFGKSNKKRYGIKVYTPHKNWKLLCHNNEERSEWIKCIARVAGYNQSIVQNN